VDYVTFDQAEKAVDFVRDEAKRYGALVGAVKGLEHQRKIVRALAFLDVKDAKNVAEREARAEVSPEYKAIIEEIENTWAEMEELKTLLKAREMRFDLYRSSNKWGGNVT